MLTEKTIYNHLSAQTIGATIYKIKPHEQVNDNGNYIYVNKLTDNSETRSLKSTFIRRARFEFVIVCKKSIWAWESVVDILNWLAEELIALYDSACIGPFNSQYATMSPIIYNEKDRPMMVVDFIFTYS